MRERGGVVRTVFQMFLMLLLGLEARAQTATAPKINEHDSWTYQHTVESRASGWQQTHMESTVLRAGSGSIVLSSQPVGSTMPPTDQLSGPDWSRFRNVNGHETVVNRPLSFPLSIGKSWEIEYSEDHPNRQHSSEHFRTVYKVIGWEDVTVAAGTFHALKLEGEGQWSAAIAPAISAATAARVDAQGATSVMQTGKTTAATVTGRTYKAFWYVPAVKKWVKSVEEYYDANGVRNERYADELEVFKVAN